MKPNIKKLLILNAPYLLFVWLFMKVGEAFRLSPGADLSGKLLNIMQGMTILLSNTGSMYGFMSSAVPQRAEPYSTPLRYFLAFLPFM